MAQNENGVPTGYDPSGQKHPDNYQNDLNPETFAGENFGLEGPNYGKSAPSAETLKELHEMLPQFTNDELKQIPVLPVGVRLQQGATYLDLGSLEQGEFTATSDMTVQPGTYLVPKSEVPYDLWNRLPAASV